MTIQAIVEPSNVSCTLEIIHTRNGKVINHVMPYETASLSEKILYWCGLKNLTR